MNYEVEKYEGELKALRRKVEVYESLMHQIQLFRSVTMDEPALIHLLDVVCDWSYAHRSGNGEVDNDALVKKHLDRLEEGPWKDSVWNSKINTDYKIRHKERAARTKEDKV